MLVGRAGYDLDAALVGQIDRLQFAPQGRRLAGARQRQPQGAALDAQGQGRRTDDDLAGVFTETVWHVRRSRGHHDGCSLVARTCERAVRRSGHMDYIVARQTHAQLRAAVRDQDPGRTVALGCRDTAHIAKRRSRRRCRQHQQWQNKHGRYQCSAHARHLSWMVSLKPLYEETKARPLKIYFLLNLLYFFFRFAFRRMDILSFCVQYATKSVYLPMLMLLAMGLLPIYSKTHQPSPFY